MLLHCNNYAFCKDPKDPEDPLLSPCKGEAGYEPPLRKEGRKEGTQE